MFKMSTEPGRVEVNAANVIPDSHIQTKRLLKIFNQQVRRIAGRQFYAVAEIGRKEFDRQVTTLRDKLTSQEFPASGNMHLVTCLPQRGKLEAKIDRSRNCNGGSSCQCHPKELDGFACRDQLYALVGVSDGCSYRLSEKTPRITGLDEVNSMVSPHQTMSIWSVLDMTFLYPSLADQQGFVCGQSTVEDSPTVLWVQKGGVLTFGSTAETDFRYSKRTRWGVPSFMTLVTI